MLKEKPPLSPPPPSEVSMDEVSTTSSQPADGLSFNGEAYRRLPSRAAQKKVPTEMSATKVFVRVRPFNRKELSANDAKGTSDEGDGKADLRPIVKIDESKPSLIMTLDPQKDFAPRHTYVFERCFNSLGVKTGVACKTLEESDADKITEDDINNADRDQTTVYMHVGRPVLENAIAGYNGCVFAYGQTGSGKTFTMMGPPTLFTAPASANGGGSAAITPGRRFSRASTANPLAGSFSGAPMAVRLHQSAHGIIPRLSKDLFDELNASRTKDSARSFRVELEYFEIYNEKVMDLLHGGPAGGGGADLKVRNAASGPFVEGLQRVHVESADDVLRYLRQGNSERHTASTRMNDRSSRSHAILSLYLTQMRITTVGEDGGGADDDEASASPAFGARCTGGGGSNPSTPKTNGPKKARAAAGVAVTHNDSEVVERRKSKMNLVDLAGSERTGASEVTGVHFKEATNINLSLTTLGRVIDALADLSQSQSSHPAPEGVRSPGGRNGSRGTGASAVNSGYGIFVPYRDSNLTWLLRDSLGGNSKTTMIATISPHCSNFDEACQTLRYASRAKQIMTKAVVNEDPQQRLIKQLAAEVDRLKKALASGKGEGMTQEDEEYMEELRERVRQLEAELADKTSQLDGAEAEIVTLRNALQHKVSASKNEVKAVAKEGEAKALKLRADVQKLENETMQMAILEDDLRREQEKVKTMERRVALVSRQAEKESKTQQQAIRKLEKENKDLESERDRLRALRADLKAAEDRENELAACLRQMEVEYQKVLDVQRRTSVVDAPGGSLRLSEDAFDRLKTLGLLPEGAAGKGGSRAAMQPTQLSALIDSLLCCVADSRNEAAQTRAGGAAAHRKTNQDGLDRHDTSSSHLGRTTGSGNVNSPRRRSVASGSGGGSSAAAGKAGQKSEKQLVKQLREAECALAALRESADAERAELQRQLLEKTDAHRRGQMELKRTREELKTEKESHVACEQRLTNEHNDAMRRLLEEVREKKVAIRETRRQQKDLSATLSAAHEKELVDLADEKERLQAAVAKLHKEQRSLLKKSKDTDEKLASVAATLAEYQGKQLEEFLAGKGGKLTKEKMQALMAAFFSFESATRASLEGEARQAAQLLFAQDELLVSLGRERAELREELARTLALREEQAAADIAAAQDALAVEKDEHARKQGLLKEARQAVEEQQVATERLQAELNQQVAALQAAEGRNEELQQRLDVLASIKADLMARIAALEEESASKEGRVEQLEAAMAREAAAHTVAMQRLRDEHLVAILAEKRSQTELSEKGRRLATHITELEGQLSSLQREHAAALSDRECELAELRAAKDAAEQAADMAEQTAATNLRRLFEEQRAHLLKDVTAMRAGCGKLELQERLHLFGAARSATEMMTARQHAKLEAEVREVKAAASLAAESHAATHQSLIAESAAKVAALEAAANDRANAFEAEVQRLNSILESAAQRNAHLETKLADAEKDVAALRIEVADLKRDRESSAAAEAEKREALIAQVEALRAEHAAAVTAHAASQRSLEEPMQAAETAHTRVIETLKEEQSTLERKLAELKSRYGESLKALVDAEERMQTTTAASEAALAERDAAVAKLQANNAAEALEHQQKLDALREARAEIEQRAAQLEEEVASLQEARAGLEDLVKSLRDATTSAEQTHATEVAELSTQIRAIQSEREALAAQLSGKEKAAVEQQQELAELHKRAETAAAALRSEKQAIEEQVEQLQRQLHAAEEDAKATAKRHQSLSESAERQRAALEAQSAKLEGDLHRSEEGRRQLVTRALETQTLHAHQVEELEKEKQQMRVEAAATAAALSKTEQALEVATSDLTARQTELEQLRAEKAEQERQLCALRASCAEAVASKDALAAELASVQALLTSETAANVAHVRTEAELTSRLTDWEAKYDQLKEGSEAAKQELVGKLAAAERARVEDQKSHAEAVDALKRVMADREEADKTALQAKDDALATNAATLEATQKDLADTKAALQAALTEKEKQRANAEAELQAVKQALQEEKAASASALAAKEGETSALQEEHEKRIALKNQDLKDLDAELAAATATAAAAQASLAEVREEREALEKALAEHKSTAATKKALWTEERTTLTEKLNATAATLDERTFTLAATQQEMETARAEFAETDKSQKESIAALNNRVTALDTQWRKAQEEVAAVREELQATQAASRANEAELTEAVAKHEAHIEELTAELGQLKMAREEQDSQMAQLQDKMAQDAKAFTAAAEKREAELTRLREDLEFRTNLDLCEADHMSFAGPANNSFDDVGKPPTGAVPAPHPARTATPTTTSGGGGGLGSMFSSFFGKGKGTSHGSATALSAASRRASFMPPLAPGMGSGSVGGTSANNSFADMTVHDLLSTGSPVAVGGRTPQRLTTPTVRGGPAPFERRASQHVASASASSAFPHPSATAGRKFTSASPLSATPPAPVLVDPSLAHAVGPLQRKQENVPPSSAPARGGSAGTFDDVKRKMTSSQQH